MTNLLRQQPSANNYAAIIARLVRGDPANGIDPAKLEKPWSDIAQAVISANGNGRMDAFESALKEISEADQIRAAVFSSDPNFDNTKEPTQIDDENDFIPLSVEVPVLPRSAHLSDALSAEASGACHWLNEYVDFANQASPMTPPEFHEMFGLIILSTAIAGRVVFPVSSTVIHANLYALGIGRSTLDHKTSGFGVARQVMEEAGLRRMILPVSLTPESLLAELTGKKSKDFELWEKSDRDDWEAERLFAAQRVWLLEEASRLLDSFNRDYSSGLLPIILDLFDCPEVRTISTVGRGRYTVRNAYLTICGATTPAALREHLNNRIHWANGLWARFLLVTPTGKPPWKFWPDRVKVPESLKQDLHSMAFDKLSVPTLDACGHAAQIERKAATLAPSVWQKWEAYAHAVGYELLLGEEVNPRLHPNYGRFATYAIKAALLLATADWVTDKKTNQPVIEVRHWARAQILVERWRESLHRLIETPNHDGGNDDFESKLIRLLSKYPQGLSSRELAMTLNKTEPREREELDRRLLIMKKDGLIQPGKRKPKRGPEADAWLLKKDEKSVS